jgi:hypothetical protein
MGRKSSSTGTATAQQHDLGVDCQKPLQKTTPQWHMLEHRFGRRWACLRATGSFSIWGWLKIGQT